VKVREEGRKLKLKVKCCLVFNAVLQMTVVLELAAGSISQASELFRLLRDCLELFALDSLL
jgi:hypothetical protein